MAQRNLTLHQGSRHCAIEGNIAPKKVALVQRILTLRQRNERCAKEGYIGAMSPYVAPKELASRSGSRCCLAVAAQAGRETQSGSTSLSTQAGKFASSPPALQRLPVRQDENALRQRGSQR